MAVKIRLRRMGARNNPFYRVVVADSRSPRDGRFIEELGYYDPKSNPAVINIDKEKAEEWIKKGAQPTETVKRLLKNN
ncbi:MAG: 30S ribosomal protein S16 [Ruminococcaceae bacterium]|nr:30S ribosomal protein S16 [Oscillospiraceae bacterium]